ncbi:MAG: 3-dehydroquinate dehydratase [Paludibacter sp.]|jgi:3-dehydroquinate dehydratase-2|nr:3-dehydroquinate dehydratase [Paludibacter sp.]
MKTIQIINGPNLNLIGIREPEIYGTQSFDAYFEELKSVFKDVNLQYFQSNCEGEIIDKIHETGFSADGIVLNAGAYSHTSLAIADAVKSITTPVIEVHISNIFSREQVRHHSFLSAVSKGIIAGFGFDSYRLAIESFF